MKIITGSTGTPHVTSNNAGELNQAIFGDENIVFDIGDALEATLVDNNNITISDGDLMIQGRHALIEPGLTENVEIDTGALGVNRHDLIVARYELDGDTGYESITLQVIKGTESSGEASDPTYNTGDIRTGSTIVDFPLYRVVITGINITSVIALFTLTPSKQQVQSDWDQNDDTKPDFIKHKPHDDTSTLVSNPLSITTDSAQVARSTKVALEPIQASGTPTPSAPIPISGYTQIDLKGTGKNLLPLNLGTIKSLNTGGTWSGNIYTYNGITFTLNINADGIIESIDISGTASQQTEFSISENTYKLNAGNYFISGIPNSKLWLNVICQKSSSGYWIDHRVSNVGYAATVGEDNRPYLCRIRVASDYTGSSTVHPQIELGSAATAYEPYHSSADISLPLPSTIYGGSLNVETGVLTIDRGIVDLGDLSWVYVSGSASRFVCSNLTVPSPLNDDTIPNLKCTCYKADTANNIVAHNTDLTIGIYENLCVYDSNYTDADTFKTAVTGQKLVYELATPYEIQLTPQQVSLLQVANVITTNGTSIELTYRNGEIATLVDLQKQGEVINKVAEIADGDKSADKITAGTFKEMVKASPTAMANLGTAQVRNSYFSDTEVVIGSASSDPEGTLRITYR